MAYSLSFADLPPMDELSLDDSQRPASRWTTSFAQTPSRLSPLSLTFPSYIGVHDLTPTKPFTDSYLSRWSVPGWQSTLDFGADLVPSLYSNTEFEAPSWGTPQFSKSPTRSLFLPRLPLPEIDRKSLLASILRRHLISDFLRSSTIAFRYVFVRIFGPVIFTSVISTCGMRYSRRCTSPSPVPFPHISSIRLFARR